MELLKIIRGFSTKSWIFLFGMLLALWILLFGSDGPYQLERLKQSEQSFLRQKEQLLSEQKNLQSEMKKMETPKYLKHLIRKDLGYVEPNEVIVKFPSSQK